MANGRRGGIPTLGFLQFNVGGQGGVIPQLNLRPAPINFPRPSGGGGGGRQRINPAVAFLPGIVGALSDSFLPKPQTLPTKQVEDPYEQQILNQADLIYGPDRANPTLLQELLPAGLDLAVAVGLGEERGGLEYAKQRIAKRIEDKEYQRDLALEKRQFINDRTIFDVPKEQTFVNLTKYKKDGTMEFREGYFTSRAGSGRGDYFLVNDAKDGFQNLLKFPDEYVTLDSFEELSSINKDPKSKDDVRAWSTQHAAQEEAAINVAEYAGSALEIINKQELGKGAGATITASFAAFGNDVFANFDVFKNKFEKNLGTSFFSQNENGGGRSIGGGGSGKKAEALYNNLKTLDLKTLVNEPAAADQFLLQVNDFADGVGDPTLRRLLSEVAGDNAILTARLLQLAYSAAATSGQTGRTLSDKDLAFFLKIVGQGQVGLQDPSAQKRNLVNYVTQVFRQIDEPVRNRIGGRRLKSGIFDEKENTDVLSIYYDFDKEVPVNERDYQFVPFIERHNPDPNSPFYSPAIQRFQNALIGGKMGTLEEEVQKAELFGDPNSLQFQRLMEERLNSLQ